MDPRKFIPFESKPTPPAPEIPEQERDKLELEKKELINRYSSLFSKYFGEDMGSMISQICNSYEPKEAKRVFLQYEKIFSIADSLKESIKTLVGEAQINENLLIQFTRNLLKRSKNILLLLIERGQFIEEVFERTEESASSLLFFGTILENLRKKGGTSFELKDFLDIEFIVCMGVQPEEAIEMREIYARNYAGNPEFQKELLDNFDSVMSPSQGYGYDHEENIFYLLKVKNRVVAFNRFHDLGGNTNVDRRKFPQGILHKEFSFFNVDPDYRGLQLGEVMMDESLEKEAKYAVIEATCTATAKIAERYIQRGFVGIGFVPDYKGIPDLSIKRDDIIKNKEFLSKKIKEDEIISMLYDPIEGPLSQHDFIIENSEIKIISFTGGNLSPFSLTDEGWTMTQYFSRNGMKYAVFEKEKPKTKEEELAFKQFVGDLDQIIAKRREKK